MKKQFLILSSMCLMLAACENRHPSDMRADNTGRNVRDRNEQALTSGSQSENAADRTITQRIRQAVMEDDSLSTNAKNIKIITIDGVVTLRGVVNNDRERNEIARKISSISGVRNVDNQIEIARGADNAARGSDASRSSAMRGGNDFNR